MNDALLLPRRSLAIPLPETYHNYSTSYYEIAQPQPPPPPPPPPPPAHPWESFHPSTTGLPLHAPVPSASQIPLLFEEYNLEAMHSVLYHAHPPTSSPSTSSAEYHYPLNTNSFGPLPTSNTTTVTTNPACRAICEPQGTMLNPEFYISEPEQNIFPTPSELLSELALKDAEYLSPDPTGATSEELFNNSPVQAGGKPRHDSARKARRRATAKSVGFIPTDPDTISSHEKKRHYLECLEQYVVYLHQQFELLGAVPATLTRVSGYRGLGSRSIRTLLVHMQKSNRKLNIRTLSEEQKFLALRDAVYAKKIRDACAAPPPGC